jgi:hypothetical protein
MPTSLTTPHPAVLIERATVDPRSLSGMEVLHLQRTIGNRAVRQLVGGKAGLWVQPKLTLGPVSDQYEQEADRVARQVARHINTATSQPVQRQELDGEETVRMTPSTPQLDGAGKNVSPEVERGIQAVRGGGEPLPETIRDSLEHAFAADFSSVKLHSDAQADQLNRSLQARAFTSGRDIFFRQGAYQPGSRGGRELLAHELTHVVQQQKPEDSGVARGQTQAGEAPRKIMRKIGFEYEMGQCYSAREKTGKGVEKVKKKKKMFDIEKIQQRDYEGGGELQGKSKKYAYEAMKKKDKIKIGTGYNLEADEKNAEVQGYALSDTEFVTAAFEESEEGLAAALAAVAAFEKDIEIINRAKAQQGVVSATDIGGESEVVIIPNETFWQEGELQVTAGVRLDKVTMLMKVMQKGREDEYSTWAKSTMETLREYRGTLGGIQSVSPGPTGTSAVEALPAVRSVYSWAAGDEKAAAALSGIVAIMAQYIKTARPNSGDIGYVKTIAPLMARTDLAAMLKEFRKQHPTAANAMDAQGQLAGAGRLVRAVETIVGPRGKPMFPWGIYTSAKTPGRSEAEKKVFDGLLWDDWVWGVYLGKDVLSSAVWESLYFSKTAEQRRIGSKALEGMGGYGKKKEKVGAGVKAPIFEIRTPGKLPAVKDLYGRVKMIFTFIVKLNQQGGGR